MPGEQKKWELPQHLQDMPPHRIEQFLNASVERRMMEIEAGSWPVTPHSPRPPRFPGPPSPTAAAARRALWPALAFALAAITTFLLAFWPTDDPPCGYGPNPPPPPSQLDRAVDNALVFTGVRPPPPTPPSEVPPPEARGYVVPPDVIAASLGTPMASAPAPDPPAATYQDYPDDDPASVLPGC